MLRFFPARTAVLGVVSKAVPQPSPCIAQQGCVADGDHRILSRLKGQALTTTHAIGAFIGDTGEVANFAIASVGRRAIEL